MLKAGSSPPGTAECACLSEVVGCTVRTQRLRRGMLTSEAS